MVSTEKTKGDIREVKSEAVKSAMRMLRDIPHLFDLIYQEFPDAYNSVSPGFSRVSSAPMFNPDKAKTKDRRYMARRAHTKFYREDSDYEYPDGFIVPLVWALRELMEYKDKSVQWAVDPRKFIKANLPKTLEVYYSMIQMANYDPQTVGKTQGCYVLAADNFRSRLSGI